MIFLNLDDDDEPGYGKSTNLHQPRRVVPPPSGTIPSSKAQSRAGPNTRVITQPPVKALSDTSNLAPQPVQATDKATSSHPGNDWAHGFFGCFENAFSCVLTTFCPCITEAFVFNRIYGLEAAVGILGLLVVTILVGQFKALQWLFQLLSLSWFVFRLILNVHGRHKLRNKYRIEGEGKCCLDCVVTTGLMCFCGFPYCFLCQEYATIDKMDKERIDPVVSV